MLFLECSCLQATASTGEPLVAKCDLEGECYCQSFQGRRHPTYTADKGCQLTGKICKVLVTRQLTIHYMAIPFYQTVEMVF